MIPTERQVSQEKEKYIQIFLITLFLYLEKAESDDGIFQSLQTSQRKVVGMALKKSRGGRVV